MLTVSLLPLIIDNPWSCPAALFQVGGSFGALFGFLLLQVLPRSWDIQPGVYALLCATAVLGGVFRSTFSLVVIVVEGTRGELARGSKVAPAPEANVASWLTCSCMVQSMQPPCPLALYLWP